MKKSAKKNIAFICFITLLCTLSFLLPVKASDKTVVRVGYPLMNGLSMKDKDGNYYGYDYDYLMQIAQYTGWEYEFVEVKGDSNQRIIKLMQMLKDGEIDLFGGTKYIESLNTDYDYTSEPYGNAYNVIVVKDDSDLVDTNSLSNKKGLRIGVLNSSTKRVPYLDQYAQTNGFTYEKIICKDQEDMMEKLDNKEIDAFLYVDLSTPDGYHSIARFSPDPFYFITTKGNTHLMSDLNKALTTINQINPTLPSTLYNRYFSGDTSNLVLNDKEIAYVNKKKTLNVLIHGGFAPMQYIEKDTSFGICKDILSGLNKKTGVTFHYIYANSYKEYKKLAKRENIDIFASLPYGSTIANTMNITLTEPFLSSNLSLITYKNVNPSNLSKRRQGTTLFNNELYDSQRNVTYYETPEDVLKALEAHEIDYTYVNNYTYMYYMNKYQFNNVSSFSSPENLRSQYAFGVVKSDDLTLLSILNKTIRAQSSMIETYVYKNAYVEKEFVFSAFLKNHILSITLSTILLLLTIFYFIYSYYKKQLKMKKAVEIEYKRYQMLSDLTKEMTFSYDYDHDTLKLSSSGIGKLSQEATIDTFASKEISKPRILELIQGYLKEKKDVLCEVESELLHGNTNWYQISIKVICSNDMNKNTAVYAVGKVIDIQKEKLEKEKLRIKSEIDGLTGIRNRETVEKAIQDALQNEVGVGALWMLDLDNFKNVNDTYGHIEGDKVLIETAKTLTSQFENCIVGRLGGDEFVVYIKNTNQEDLHKYCQDTIQRFHNFASMEDKNFTLSVSIGVALTTHTKNYMELLKIADHAMYEMKRQGRNGYQIM